MGDLANEWRPLCVVPASPIEGGVAFHFPTEVVQVLDAPDVVWAVVRESSGSRVASDVARAVAAEVPIAVESALAVLDELREHNIVLDAESVYLPFHALTKNPQPFPSIKPYPQSCAADNGGFTHVDIPRNGSDTPLAFARRRRSCRSFTEQRISSTLILTIATDSLGFEHQIPSAGNLHPLRLDVVVFRGDESLPRGVYSYSPEQASLLDRHRELELDVFRHALNSEELVFGAPVVMVISACFRRTTWKYGNRGYRFVLLEAGQAAQNILLSATALGIASVEYGGFLDGALRDALGSRGVRTDHCDWARQ